MKFLIVFGVFLVLLVQASLQYPHNKKQQKLLLFPETIAEEIFDNPDNIIEETSNENEMHHNVGESKNDKNIITLDSEDLMNLFATKIIDNFALENQGSDIGNSRKRYRRGGLNGIRGMSWVCCTSVGATRAPKKDNKIIQF